MTHAHRRLIYHDPCQTPAASEISCFSSVREDHYRFKSRFLQIRVSESKAHRLMKFSVGLMARVQGRWTRFATSVPGSFSRHLTEMPDELGAGNPQQSRSLPLVVLRLLINKLNMPLNRAV